MAKSKHYCADCNTHFRTSIQTHADQEHDGGIFRGIENGNYKDYKRRVQHKL